MRAPEDPCEACSQRRLCLRACYNGQPAPCEVGEDDEDEDCNADHSPLDDMGSYDSDYADE